MADNRDTSDNRKALAERKSSDVDAFLRQVAAAPVPARSAVGRLIFALDATASRQPTWDRACHIQAEMFATTASLGGLAIQLCYFRGFQEFHVEPWLTDGRELVKRMTGVTCLSGTTQLTRVLRHAIRETTASRVNALVYVGDCMEESADTIAGLAGKLGLLGVPAFVFQEGDDPVARPVFQRIAELTKGAYARFDSASAKTLRELLMAVAVYAAGGRRALADYADRSGGEAARLTRLLR
ncbi:MAG TPA: VWA domain-containing protein [Acidisphaera sp.]|nr:VWA domain-containing protein [Acidisphaera sp.]